MSDLRPLTVPVAPMPHGKVRGTIPEMAIVPISKLRIDPRFQRDITRRGLATISKICANFSWSRFAPLMVARVPGEDGLCSVIDGQHRATAALILGIVEVPCAIVNATETEQAAIFSAVNGNVTPVTILQLFKAARASNAEWAHQIDAACAMGGLTALVYPKARSEIKPFETMAIGTLRRAIIRFGVDDVGKALAVAAKEQGAGEPGFWNSIAIDQAIADHRTSEGKREVVTGMQSTTAERIRELHKRGHSRFAIQAALRVKLADIEAAIGGAA